MFFCSVFWAFFVGEKRLKNGRYFNLRFVGVFGTFLDVLNRMFFCSVFWAFFWVKNVSKTDGFYLRFLGVFGTNLEVLKTSQKRKKIISKTLKKRLKNGYLKNI